MRENLSAARLREVLDYDKNSGIFSWRVRTGGNSDPGVTAGSIDERGYVRIGVDGEIYRAHRLAWLHVHGCWPNHEIDHIDGNKTNNQIANLRDVPRAVNQQNQRSALGPRENGLLGATFHPGSGKWRARVWTSGRNKSLGLFDTANEAHQAYVAAKRALHKGCSL